MKTPLCIYHGNCADGFGAAWAVRQALGANCVEFHAATHQDPPPDVTGRHVIMVDFAYKAPVMAELAKRTCGVLVLDHHKSAIEDLTPLCVKFRDELQIVKSWQNFLENVAQDDMEGCAGSIYAVFDLQRSGAGIAWDFFHTWHSRPELINHIEDRDLWRFRLPGTREIQAALFSYPYEFDTWTRLMEMPVRVLLSDGFAIERKHHKDVAELVRASVRKMEIGGHEVPVANLPYTMSSDAGHLMAQGQPFAACYFDTPAGRVFSLRSTDQGLDVSEVAKLYGGGGHRNAAGFRVPFERCGVTEVRQ